MTTPQDGPTSPTGAAAPLRQYEFGPEESRLFGDLAAKMRFVGLLTALCGTLAFLYAVFEVLGGRAAAPLLVVVVVAILLILIGVWTQKAGGEFQLVEETVGKDISHVLGALANLHKLYALQYWIGWAALILLIIAVVFGYFIDPAH